MSKATLTTGQVITLGDGRLVCGFEEVYEAVDVLLDDNISTIGLLSAIKYLKPRIQAECPWVKHLPSMPRLDGLTSDEKSSKVKEWVEGIYSSVGDYHEIPDMSKGWKKRSPLDDLEDIVDIRTKNK